MGVFRTEAQGIARGRQRRETAIFSDNCTGLWPDGKQESQAVALVSAALAASCAEWTAKYATYDIFEARVPRASRSSGSAPDAVVELGGVVSSGMRASVAKRCVVVGEKARAARAKTGS